MRIATILAVVVLAHSVNGLVNPNEPVNFTPVSSRPFDAKIENGWGDRGDAAFSIVQDVTAPVSPQNIGQAKYNTNRAGGTGPIQTGLDLRSYNYRSIYMSFWVKHSANWQDHSSGVNKIFHIWIAGGNKVYLNAKGVAPQVPNATLRAEVALQGVGVPVPSISWNAVPNVGAGKNAYLPRDKWHRWEIVLVANTPGQLDGRAMWWIDGVFVGNYSNIGYSSANETGSKNEWEHIDWNPTWGGTGDTVTSTMYMWMDQIYVSGAPQYTNQPPALPAQCGDNTCQIAETCSSCSQDCGSCATTPPPVCGNSVIESGEQCDLGNNNGACPSTCTLQCTTQSCQPQQKTGDLDNNGVVDILDVQRVVSRLGISGVTTGEDVNADGAVDLFDLVILAQNWG